jgi:hypothetical protein
MQGVETAAAADETSISREPSRQTKDHSHSIVRADDNVLI